MYKRRHSRGRRGSRRGKRHSRGRKPTIRKVEKQIKKLEKQSEVKVVSNQTSSFTGTAIFTNLSNTNPLFFLINGLSRGTQYNTRLADKVKATSIQVDIELYFTSISNVGGVDDTIRVMLVDFKKPRGSAMTLCNTSLLSGATALFYNSTGYPTCNQHIDWGIGTEAYEQYKILYDKRHKLRTHVAWYDGSHAQTVNPSMYITIRKKLGTTVDYSRGNAGTVADLETHGYYLIFITDSNQAVSGNIDSRFYYKDG